MVGKRGSARQALSARLDGTARAAALTTEIGSSTADVCAAGTHNWKVKDEFNSKCTLMVRRAYAWDGEVDALLDRLPSCSGASRIRSQWNDLRGKTSVATGHEGPYDAGDLPEMSCGDFTIGWASRATPDSTLKGKHGARTDQYDLDINVTDRYHWSIEGRSWLPYWQENRARLGFMLILSASKDYATN